MKLYLDKYRVQILHSVMTWATGINIKNEEILINLFIN